MKKYLALLILLSSLSVSAKEAGLSNYYGPGLCQYEQYKCIKISAKKSWEKLFPNPIQRDLVQRLNRTYNKLTTGKTIVVPRNLDNISLLDIAPFTHKINSQNEKHIVIDQEKLAWAAYDEKGLLVNWGPISSGQDKCSDSDNSCRTLTGSFRVFSKENENCISNAFPAGEGGAKMPYCMFFHKGYALHGSDDMPGYRASHGCIRIFTKDARWLNQNFVNASTKENNFAGTIIIVRPLLKKNEQITD